MKKHLLRAVIYASLIGASTLVLSPAYLWQSVFGPKIRGVPVCAWQHDTRVAFSRNGSKPTVVEKTLEFMGIHVSPTYIDDFRFPARDPEMLPVLISLADDRNDEVRIWVAYSLGDLPAQKDAITVLVRLADDPDKLVRECAQKSLDRHAK